MQDTQRMRSQHRLQRRDPASVPARSQGTYFNPAPEGSISVGLRRREATRLRSFLPSSRSPPSLCSPSRPSSPSLLLSPPLISERPPHEAQFSTLLVRAAAGLNERVFGDTGWLAAGLTRRNANGVTHRCSNLSPGRAFTGRPSVLRTIPNSSTELACERARRCPDPTEVE